MSDLPLTKEECLHILDRYANWNTGQKSIDKIFRGERTVEDDILDARRALLLAATKRLKELAEARAWQVRRSETMTWTKQGGEEPNENELRALERASNLHRASGQWNLARTKFVPGAPGLPEGMAIVCIIGATEVGVVVYPGALEGDERCVVVTREVNESLCSKGACGSLGPHDKDCSLWRR